MSKLTIVPLGLPNSLTRKAYSVMADANNRSALVFQTILHPSVTYLLSDFGNYTSLDALYETSEDFDSLNERIADALICDRDLCYAVAGRGVGREQLNVLLARANACNTEIEILPASGYAEAAAAKALFSLSGASIYVASSIPENINIYMPVAVEDIDTKLRASEVKLALCEYYPEDFKITFAYTDKNGDYIIRNILLFELDRQAEFFASTVVLLPPCEFLSASRHGLEGVVEIMRILRGENGCPWDIKQTHESLKTPLIEEAYEVMDTIVRNDTEAMTEELGDLLLQIVFHAQIEAEKSCFTMRDVCTGIVKKLIYRHPHVFANADGINTSDDVLVAWEALKKVEKQQKTQTDVICAIPKCFPALMRSYKVQKKAADVGFDWDSADGAIEKLYEEASELERARKGDGNITEEFGDLLFSAVNVARLLKIDPEIALAEATDKFVTRFALMERLVTDDGKSLANMTLSEMDMYWETAKSRQKQ